MDEPANQSQTGFVNDVKLPNLDPPANTVGLIGWLRNNLFNGIVNSILTLAGIALLFIIIPPILNWTIFDAVWSGGSDACRTNPDGACWAFAGSWWEFFLYGFYEKDRTMAC